MDINSLLIQFTALSGTAALIAVVINILKSFSIVKDGQAPIYSAVLNMFALGGLIALNIFSPLTDVKVVDAQVAGLAETLVVVFGYITQLGISKLSHKILRTIPIIGKSATEDFDKKLPF